MKDLSASRIKTMDDCKKLFYRKYIVKDLPDEESSPFAELGGAIHKVLEVYRENVGTMDRRDMSTLFDKEFNPTNRFDFLKRQGQEIIYKIDLDKIVLGELVAVEFEFEEDFGDVCMRGIVDKIELVNETLVITDYKTNQTPEPKEYLHQLAIYDMAMQRIYPDIPKRYELFYVRHNQVFDFTFPDDYHIKVAHASNQTARMITENSKNSMAWPQLSKKGKVCSWCPLVDQCWPKKRK